MPPAKRVSHVVGIENRNRENQTARGLGLNHVERKTLIGEEFYDGIIFHRVIDGFMAQTGDPTGTGMAIHYPDLRAEFSSEPFKRGTWAWRARNILTARTASSLFALMMQHGWTANIPCSVK